MSKSSALIAALAATTFATTTFAADDVAAPADGTNLTQAVQEERRADCVASIDAVTRAMPDGTVSDESRAAAEASLQAARLAQQAENQEVCATLVDAARDLLGQERDPEQAATGAE